MKTFSAGIPIKLLLIILVMAFPLFVKAETIYLSKGGQEQ